MKNVFSKKALYLKSIIRYSVLGVALCVLAYLVQLNPALRDTEQKLVEHFAMCIDNVQYVIHSDKAIILKKQDGKKVNCPRANLSNVYKIYIDEKLYVLE